MIEAMVYIFLLVRPKKFCMHALRSAVHKPHQSQEASYATETYVDA